MYEKRNSDLINLPDEAKSMPAIEWVAEQMPGGFFIYRADETKEILYVNSAAIRIFGCKTLDEFKELTGYTFEGLVYPEDYQEVEKSIEAQIADAGNSNMDEVEYRIVRKDGSIRWIEDYGYCTEMQGYGKVYSVFISDITAKKEIQRENRLAAQVIKGLSVDYSCIYLLNLDTGMMRVYHLKNDHFRKISAEIGILEGQTEDWHKVLKKYAELFIIPEDQELFLHEIEEQRIRERLASDDSFSVNYRCRTEDGGIVYVSMFVNRTKSDGPNQRVVMSFRDATEDTLAFQRDLASKLETELQLEREKHANEIKSQFLFNVSHDIRTPMNAIMGFVGLAKRHMADPERLEEYLDHVEESGSQLLQLIDDLLEMSKIEYGRVDLKAEPCKLKEQIGVVLDLFKPEAEEKNLIVIEKLELPDEETLVDAYIFRRIMGNLISNAVKFTPPNGRVQVEARRKQLSGSGFARYEFIISDNGVGMTEEFMRRMYDAFEQEKSSTEAGTKGTGLGLSIVKNLVDMMGGSLTAQSKKGEGTTVTFSLPLKVASYADGAAGGKDTGKASAAGTDVREAAGTGTGEAGGADTQTESEAGAKGKHRVLLVEDIEINRMLAETILEEAGYLVESVPDGCDAVEAVQNHPEWYFDLVLMDIQMPVMNGYEATRAIRAINRSDTKSLPIIALSANAREEDKRMSLESGMNSHVAKPFDIDQLISTINGHIEARNDELL